ncbi:MAG: hypothetical protein M0007_14120 [Actinomycetota bacterium]|nr:hypothetical protein [Actinomycetota bacterium]
MRKWRKKAGAVVIAGLMAAGVAYMAESSVSPSSVGNGAGRVTLTTTSLGQITLHTTAFHAP